MTKEEIRLLAELQTKFEERCKEVCSILKNLDYEYGNLHYFIMDEDRGFGIGHNYDYKIIEVLE